MTVLGDNIRLLAEQAGGQTLLAESIGVSQGAISRWISGKPPRKMDALAGAARIARVSVDQLLSVPLAQARAQSVVSGSHAAVMMPVSLPNEADLTDMFVGMLHAAGQQQLADVLAPVLAQHLPGGLARTIGLQPLPVSASDGPQGPEGDRLRAGDRRESRSQPRI